MNDEDCYVSVHTEIAPKVGRHSSGGVSYAILRNVEGTACFLTITGNEGGGYFSKEIVPFIRIVQCLQDIDAAKPIPAKVLKEVFANKSANNAGFIVAVLRHQGLLVGVPNAAHLHLISGDWKAWENSFLKIAGKPYVPAQGPEHSVKAINSSGGGAGNKRRKGGRVLHEPASSDEVEYATAT